MVLSANNNSLINVKNLPVADRYCVAFSGGVDSTALLISAAQINAIKTKLFAIHINHNIQTDSSQWAKHCADICSKLGISLISETVKLKDYSENTCREARIGVFKKHLNKSDCLLTAHHADDQVETILFRLLRGTGTSGLKGMTDTVNHFGYQHHRPFLSLSKKSLEQFVQQQNINHIYDSSNLDTTFRRNYIRNIIIPKINNYETKARQNIILTATNIANSNQLLKHLLGKKNPLSIQSFKHQKILASAIYHWLDNLNQKVNATQKQLLQFAKDCLNSGGDRLPELDLNHLKLIKWKDQIYALTRQPSIAKSTKKYQLKSNQVINITSGSLLLSSEKAQSIEVTVNYQQIGQRILLENHNINKKIKNLFQENEIPPWIRQCIPYIYINDQLMAVGSLFLSQSFKQYLKSNNAQFEWLSPQFLL